MKTIVAGGRDGINAYLVEKAINAADWEITTLVCGMARGVDSHAYNWAKRKGVPIEEYPADWDRYKKAAGHIRNAEMADNAEALIAIWDGESPGTGGMIGVAEKKGLKVLVVKILNIPPKRERHK